MPRQETLGLTDAAIRLGLSYQEVYGRALKGSLGVVRRDGRRLLVTVRGVAQYQEAKAEAAERRASAPKPSASRP